MYIIYIYIYIYIYICLSHPFLSLSFSLSLSRSLSLSFFLSLSVSPSLSPPYFLLLEQRDIKLPLPKRVHCFSIMKVISIPVSAMQAPEKLHRSKRNAISKRVENTIELFAVVDYSDYIEWDHPVLSMLKQASWPFPTKGSTKCYPI